MDWTCNSDEGDYKCIEKSGGETSSNTGTWKTAKVSENITLLWILQDTGFMNMNSMEQLHGVKKYTFELATLNLPVLVLKICF
jgi:hypothetical protein